MTPLKYIGPFDEIEIEGHPGAVKQGEEFEVDGDLSDLAKALLAQHANFEPLDEEGRAYVADLIAAELEANTEPELVTDPDVLGQMTIPQLRKYADAFVIDLGGASLKDDIVAAIVAAQTEPEGA